MTVIFPSIGNVIMPTDSYFSEGFKTPTRMIWYDYISLNEITTSRRDRTVGIMVFIGKSSPNGRKIQGSDILQFTQIIW